MHSKLLYVYSFKLSSDRGSAQLRERDDAWWLHHPSEHRGHHQLLLSPQWPSILARSRQVRSIALPGWEWQAEEDGRIHAVWFGWVIRSLLSAKLFVEYSNIFDVILVSGRRKCMGDTLAKAELFLVISTLLQTFRFSADDIDSLPDPKEATMGVTLVPPTYKLKAEKLWPNKNKILAAQQFESDPL